MKELATYIFEKFKISKNTVNNNLYKINDNFTINPAEDYYTLRFYTEKNDFNSSHIIYKGNNNGNTLIVYLYSKSELKQLYMKNHISDYIAQKFPDKYKEEVQDIIDNKIETKDFLVGE